MRYDELIGMVQSGAALPDRATAEGTAEAVLRTLSERVPDGLAHHLAAQLPAQLADPMLAGTSPAEPGPGPSPEGDPARGEPFGLSVFAGRVAWRAGIAEDEALHRTAAVLEVLDAAVSPEMMEKVARVLPGDIRALLPLAGPDGDGDRPG
ncbi:DUF2267 domain-containing protein [Streptomyces sp. NPDC058045]|uniref:DUF2267 domain-containing protein n=1 Tax=Streptomyces sp. NPDC058045 TaxID=3346311 RepID=UPI0036E6B9A1